MKHPHWKEVVPAAKHDAVTKAFTQAFGTLEIDDIVRLLGGRSSALVYKIFVNQQPYVMRLVMQADALTDPARHFAAMNAAAREGLAPPVRYTNADDAISIVDFIEHTPLTAWFTAEKELFGEFARIIKSIHALPLFAKLVNFLDGVDSLIQRFESSGVLPASATEEHFRYYSTIQRVYPRDDDLVSSHNDLNPTNILHNGGKIWIIDWEGAFANDRYVDLALVNIFFGSGERGEEVLLDAYLGAPASDYHRARFFVMQQVCFFYVSMLFMHLVTISSQSDAAFESIMETIRLHEFFGQLRSGEISLASPEEHLLFAKVLLNESLLQMKTARFRESIEFLEASRSASAPLYV
jgi:aminoglycoside phosphotransferase (APT) family kinase protein